MQHELFKPSPKPWKPHAYQKRAMKFLLEHASAALFLDPGLGKTSITLGAIKVLKKKKMFGKALIIAPLRVCHSVWPGEQEKWTDFKDLTIEVLHGPKKQEALEREADVYLINPEGLDWLLDTKKTRTPSGKVRIEVDTRRFKKLGFDTLVIDELSKFKHASSGRFKALKLVHHLFDRRWGLTGSPASNGLMDLFGQCFILDQGRTLGPYITHFRNKYFLPHPSGFGWVIREGAAEEIYERVEPLALRMAADDYLDLPKLIPNNIRVDLPPKVRQVYDQLEADMLAKVGEKIITAANAAAASTKCRQVANGGVYMDPDILKLLKEPKSKREWTNLHTEKLDALEDLIEELSGSPLLVAYDFEHDLDRLKSRFGKDIPYIGGGVTAKRSKELEQAWNRGELPYLFGHPASIGHGLNLQEGDAHHVCWHSLTWDYELYDQFIRRVLRQGNRHQKVFVHHLIARDTVDEAMLGSLKSKMKGQNALFDALKKLAKARK